LSPRALAEHLAAAARAGGPEVVQRVITLLGADGAIITSPGGGHHTKEVSTCSRETKGAGPGPGLESQAPTELESDTKSSDTAAAVSGWLRSTSPAKQRLSDSQPRPAGSSVESRKR